jgi:HK97 family phage major capsid protein
MKTVKQLKEEIEALCNHVMAIAETAKAENRDFTAEEQAEVDRIQGSDSNPGEIHALEQALKRAEKLDEVKAKIAGEKAVKALGEQPSENKVKSITVPARARATGKLQAFKSESDAYAAGKFFQATLGGNKRAMQWCKEHGIVKNAMTTGDNTKGGFLVPEPLENTIVELREKYGVFRQSAQQMTMPDAVMLVPKLQSEVTAYYVGEGDPVNARNSITASDMALQQIKLEAKKLATLTVISNELSEDAVISIADMLTRSIAYQFARNEDLAGFLGDGTSTYGGIVGVANALGSASKITATSNTTFGALTMANFESVIGARKMWAGSYPAWYISQVGWANSMQRLMDAYSGNTILTIADGSAGGVGMPRLQFLGFPVVISQVLESRTSGTSGGNACFFGDLSQSVMMGTHRGLSVQTDQSLYFNYDAIAVRATERYDINVHDRGDSTTAGGLTALIFG